MIRIYSNTCEDFDNNGLGVLTDFKTSPKITESLNGSFELNFDYAIQGKNVEYLVADNIIKAPYDGSEQLFRIRKVKPNLSKINIYATHIFYDLSENYLIDVAPTKTSAVNAISWLLEHAMFLTKFTVRGDMSDLNSARYVRKNIVDALLGADNCIVKRWGGEIERDNFNIIYHRQRGMDRGVWIKHGKNIKEIELAIDFTSIVTRIIPQGANELLLPEMYVDSPIINTYRNPIVAKYEFSNIMVDENTTEEQAYELLREEAKKLFSHDNIDKPTISVKVDWLELSKTEEYKKYSNLEFVHLGDTVTVQALGYEYKIRVIKVVYDCLLNTYTSFEIGDPKADFIGNTSKNIATEIQKSSSSLLQQAKQMATTLINNGFGGHVRIYPDRILLMDTDDEATAKNVWQWNLNGLGYSSTGINGEYGTAITQDGHIVADFITTGQMEVERIKGLKEILLSLNQRFDFEKTNSNENKLYLENAYQGPLLELKIKGNIRYVYPSSTTYPSSKLFTRNSNLIVDKQETLSEEAKIYKLPYRNLYYYNDEIYDEFVIKQPQESEIATTAGHADGNTYIIHRCEFIDGEVVPLVAPWTEYFADINIELFDGNNYIYMYSFPNDNIVLEATYALRNELVNKFALKVELTASIQLLMDTITLAVSKKVDADTFNSTIEQTVENITSIVNKKVDNSEFGTKITQNAEAVRLAWNQISQYLQFEVINGNASLAIYDETRNLIMKIDKDGQWFYEENKQIGKIGTVYRNGEVDGLAFFLKNANTMDWCVYDEETKSYISKLLYEKGKGLITYENFYYVNDDGIITKYPTASGIERFTLSVGLEGEEGLKSLDVWTTDGSIYSLFFNTSDGRLKENIQPSKINALKIINQLKFRSFDWKENHSHQELGLIAQELEEIDKNLIAKVPQRDQDNKVVDYLYQINNNSLLIYLSKAVTELSQQLKEYQEQISYLMKKTGYHYTIPTSTVASEEVAQYSNQVKKADFHQKEKGIKIKNIKGKWVKEEENEKN